MGVGILKLFGNMNSRINDQIQLDQFTGKIALEMRACLITMENSQSRLEKARLAVIAACGLVPVGCTVATELYEALKTVEDLIQKNARLVWNEQKLLWIAKDPLSTLKNSFPDIDESLISGKSNVRIESNGLISAASVWSNMKGIKPHDWKTAWTE